MVKHDIRAIGVDDSPFSLHTDSRTHIVGVVYRGKNCLVDVVKSEIAVDGDDVTEKICSMVRGSKVFDQIRVVFLSGLTFGGFNTADIRVISRVLGLPVVVVIDRRPDYEMIRLALGKIGKTDSVWPGIEAAGEVHEFVSSWGRVYFQCAGASPDEAIEFISNFQLVGALPEPLRVAHIIAKLF